MPLWEALRLPPAMPIPLNVRPRVFIGFDDSPKPRNRIFKRTGPMTSKVSAATLEAIYQMFAKRRCTRKSAATRMGLSSAAVKCAVTILIKDGRVEELKNPHARANLIRATGG